MSLMRHGEMTTLTHSYPVVRYKCNLGSWCDVINCSSDHMT
jgi:hypothetical protein